MATLNSKIKYANIYDKNISKQQCGDFSVRYCLKTVFCGGNELTTHK